MRENEHALEAKDYERARRLRREASGFEKKVRNALREISPVVNLKFRRLQPIHPYIADFACMKAKLLVGLDGDLHDARQTHDRRRDKYLRSLGYTVMCINNDEVTDNLSNVVETIVANARSLILSNTKTSG